jgi:hypothetical protein
MKKYIILLTFLALSCNNEYSYCGIKQISIKIKNVVWWTLSNRYVQTYVADALFIYGEGVCNAKCDAFIFDNLYGDKITYGVSNKNWHSYKNLGRSCTWGAIGLMALGLGQKHFTLKETLIRFGSIGIMSNVVWHKVYYKSRYNSYWDTGHAQNYITIPYGKDDIRIGLQGNQVYMIDAIQLIGGIGGLIYLEDSK